MLSRGNKKAELSLPEKSRSSEEDVGEEDNYPAPFKALIQAKKSKVRGVLEPFDLKMSMAHSLLPSSAGFLGHGLGNQRIHQRKKALSQLLMLR